MEFLYIRKLITDINLCNILNINMNFCNITDFQETPA